MYTFYLSPLCQDSLLRSIQSSDIQLSAMVCHFSPPSLFPASYHPILSTSLCTPHLTATRPFVSSSYPSGSRRWLQWDEGAQRAHTSSFDEMSVVNEEIQWARKLRADRKKKNDEIVARHRKRKRIDDRKR